MLITPLGEPIAPIRAQEALRAVSPRLFLKWVSGVMEYWAICERWMERDPRREMIQRGELAQDADFDVKHFLPMGCSPEEVEGFVLRNFVRVDDARKMAEEAVDATERANAAHKAKMVENFEQEQIDKTVRTTKHEL